MELPIILSVVSLIVSLAVALFELKGYISKLFKRPWKREYSLPTKSEATHFVIPHDTKSRVNLSIVAIDVVNPLRIEIYQRTLKNPEVYQTSFSFYPSVFPYETTLLLPYTISDATKIIIQGGGPSEIGKVYLELIEENN